MHKIAHSNFKCIKSNTYYKINKLYVKMRLAQPSLDPQTSELHGDGITVIPRKWDYRKKINTGMMGMGRNIKLTPR